MEAIYCGGTNEQTFDEHLAKGISLLETGDNKGAAAEFRRCMKIEPENPEGYFNLGEALAADEDLEGASTGLSRGARESAEGY